MTLSNAPAVVPGPPPTLWHSSIIACSALRRITIGNLITRLIEIIVLPVERKDLQVKHGCQIHEMIFDQTLQLADRGAVAGFLVSIRVTG